MSLYFGYDGSSGESKLSHKGFKMSGDIDMDTHGIENIKYPQNDNSAASKKFVDDEIAKGGAGGIRDVGFTMKGDINMNNHEILSLPKPSDNASPATKKYVDDETGKLQVIANTKLSTLSGGTMKGNIDMGLNSIINLTNPQNPADAANKTYVDTLTSMGHRASDLDMANHKILNLAAPTTNADAANKKYVDTHISGKTSHDGSVPMTGDLNMNNHKIINLQAPTSNTDASNKKYVDDEISSSSLQSVDILGKNRMQADLDLNSYKVIDMQDPANVGDAATKRYVDAGLAKKFNTDGTSSMSGDLQMNGHEVVGGVNKENVKYTDREVNKVYKLAINEGGKNYMRANLDLAHNKIINLGAPTANTDAATKKYVDDNVTTTSLGTADVNLNNHKIFNLATPTNNADAATKKYVDDNTTTISLGSADVNLNNHKIFNLATPTNNADAATKKYVDDNAGTTIRNTNLDMKNHKIISLAAPTVGGDATNKTYVDARVSSKLSFDGSNSMSGVLNMGGNQIKNLAIPTHSTDATNKQYVDFEIGSSINKDGSIAMTNDLNLNSNKIINLAAPTVDADAANKKYVDDHAGSKFSPSGNLDMKTHKIVNVGTPTLDADAVTKKYSDDSDYRLLMDINKCLKKNVGGYMSAAINMDNNRILGLPTPTTADDAANKKYVDDSTAHRLSTTFGGSMSADIDMHGHNLLNVADPVSSGDGANKKYVDGKVFTVDEKNIVIVDKNRYRLHYTTGSYQGFSFIDSGSYTPYTTIGSGFAFKLLGWKKVPLLGYQKCMMIACGPLNSSTYIHARITMPNKFYSAGKNFGLVFAISYNTADSETSFHSVELLYHTSTGLTLQPPIDIKSIGKITLNKDVFEYFIANCKYKSGDNPTKIYLSLIFNGLSVININLYNGYIFDGITDAIYKVANVTDNINYPHFPGYDKHKFLDCTVGDTLIAGKQDVSTKKVRVKELAIYEDNVDASVTTAFKKLIDPHVTLHLFFKRVNKTTKIYPNGYVAFPVLKGGSTIKLVFLTHRFETWNAIPSGTKIRFGMMFFLENKNVQTKELSHIVYDNYKKDTAGIALLNQATYTQVPSDCIAFDIYLQQDDNNPDLNRQSGLLINLFL